MERLVSRATRLLRILSSLVCVVAMLVVMVIIMCPRALACASSALFLVAASGALSPPFLLVPGTEGLATEGQVVVLDDGDGHPRISFEVNFLHRRVGWKEVWM